MVYSEYLKERILFFYMQGLKAPSIVQQLREEGLHCTKPGVHEFLKRFQAYGLVRKAGSGRKTKVTGVVCKIVEEAMRKDDETTAHQLCVLLASKGYSLSIDTILRCRSLLGWTFRGSAYCQLIRDTNKLKRYQRAVANQDDEFDDCIYTDECSVQL